MKPVPNWSFLAIEPYVKSVIRRKPILTTTFLRSRAPAGRACAFWELVSLMERDIAKSAPQSLCDRHRLAIQIYYALVDLTELSNANDREIQRRLTTIMRHEASAETANAVVRIPAVQAVS